MNGHALLQRAADLIQAGNVGDGAAACRQLLASQPGHPDALHLLAMATRSSDPQDAERLFRESLARAPRAAERAASISPISCARRVGWPRQKPLLRAATEMAPDFVPGWYNLGHSAAPRGTAGGSGTLREPGPTRFRRRMRRVGNCAPRSSSSAATSPPQSPRVEPDCVTRRPPRGCITRSVSYCARIAASPRPRRPMRPRSRAVSKRRISIATAVRPISRPAIAHTALTVLDAGVTRYPDNALLHRLRAGLHWETGAPGDPARALAGGGAQQSSRRRRCGTRWWRC